MMVYDGVCVWVGVCVCVCVCVCVGYGDDATVFRINPHLDWGANFGQVLFAF
jgi:hypothetical protein